MEVIVVVSLIHTGKKPSNCKFIDFGHLFVEVVRYSKRMVNGCKDKNLKV